MTQKKLILIIAILISMSTVAFAQDFTAPDVLKVHGAFSTDRLRQGSDVKLALVLDVKKNYHVNANVPTADFPTKVELKSIPGIKFDEPQYPSPIMRSFNFAPNSKLPVYEGQVIVRVSGKVDKDAKLGSQVISGTVSYQSCDETSCYPPGKVAFQVPITIVKPTESVNAVNQSLFTDQKAQDVPVDKQTLMLVHKIEKGGLWFLFLAGMLLCLTPCVFPMIPVIVGYFGSQGQGKKSRVSVLAFLFVLGLAFTYSVIGTAASLAGKGLGNAMQHPVVPILVSGILVALALSLFGLYDIPVPSFIANRSQARSGALGALVMGLVFGLVAAPCVGPAVAALLIAVAQIGNPIRGFMMFFALSMGLGTPFFFLALFSGSLARIPKPGTWMVTIRKVFGFLLLGAALYYVEHLLPKAAANIAIPAFLVVTGIYWIWLEKSTKHMRNFRRVQQVLGIGVAVMGAWFIVSPSNPSIVWTPYKDQAVVSAQKDHKPVIIDFTARYCTPCRELEHTTFADPAVRREANRFVRLSVDFGNKVVSDKPAAKYHAPAPPVIVLIGSNGKEQARVIGYINASEFLKKLQTIK